MERLTLIPVVMILFFSSCQIGEHENKSKISSDNNKEFISDKEIDSSSIIHHSEVEKGQDLDTTAMKNMDTVHPKDNKEVVLQMCTKQKKQ